MTTTDTPRTNKKAVAHSEGFCVSIAFARELERELNASKAEVEKMKEQLYDCLSYVSHHPIGASSAISKQIQRGVLATLNPTEK